MDPTDDDELLAELGAAMRGAAQVPARFVAVGKSAFAFRGISAEIAALTHDSAGAEFWPAPEPSRPRCGR